MLKEKIDLKKEQVKSAGETKEKEAGLRLRAKRVSAAQKLEHPELTDPLREAPDLQNTTI